MVSKRVHALNSVLSGQPLKDDTHETVFLVVSTRVHALETFKWSVSEAGKICYNHDSFISYILIY